MVKLVMYLVLIFYLLTDSTNFRTFLLPDVSTQERTLAFERLHKRYPWLSKVRFEQMHLAGITNNLHVNLIAAIVEAESRGTVTAAGPTVIVRLGNGLRIRTRALGLMQVIPEFHAGASRWRLYQPEFNITIGSKYFAWCLKAAKGSLVIALKNYNSGPHSNFFNWPYIKRIMKNFIASLPFFERMRFQVEQLMIESKGNHGLLAASL